MIENQLEKWKGDSSDLLKMTKKTNFMIVESQISRFVRKELEFSISNKLFEALNEEIKKLLLKAVERAKQNKRKTLYARDI